ncbi:GNAT family N-acetyltransferase [Sandarakinorhabdus sp. AAP62]|uniref:GNAT family N-acetyltransferase n=1 Tax=Sandarakinorhabdus sp. AAP62 TaxID=1248916 RepID=UPI0002F01338|nr:GNAT family N-acetyltransferase [Sandarakinorhabdus sp. AAP62]
MTANSAFDRQPTLAHPALTLRPATAEDWPATFAAANDPGIWEGHPASNRWQEPVFRAFFEDGLASGGMLVAQEPATGVIIGSSRFDFTRVEPGEVEVGWTFLVRRHWGSTTNHVMKALMVGHALQTLDTVIFMIGETNIRSRTAVQRIGATLIDRIATVALSTGPVTHVHYALDRAAFAAGPLAPLWAQRIS